MANALSSGELQDVTEVTLKRGFNGRGREDARCRFCGHLFQVGEQYRFVYTNDTEGQGNPLCCGVCASKYSTEELRMRWITMHRKIRKMAKGNYWWFFQGSAFEEIQEY